MKIKSLAEEYIKNQDGSEINEHYCSNQHLSEMVLKSFLTFLKTKRRIKKSIKNLEKKGFVVTKKEEKEPIENGKY